MECLQFIEVSIMLLAFLAMLVLLIIGSNWSWKNLRHPIENLTSTPAKRKRVHRLSKVDTEVTKN